MRCEPTFDFRRLVFAFLQQDLEKVGYTLGVVPGAAYVDHGLRVSLQLVETAIASKDGCPAHLHRDLSESAMADVGKGAHGGDTQIRLLRLFHLLYRMPLDDVSDLMAQRTREFVETGGALDEPAIDVHEPAGQGERIYVLDVDDVEMPVEIGATRRPCDRLSQVLHVNAHDGIRDDRQ